MAVLGAQCAAQPDQKALSDKSPPEQQEKANKVQLPFAQGQTFATLDEYLAHRRKLGAHDVPYYDEISPGRYRLVTGRGDRFSEPKFFSREQLLREFGFSR